MLQASGSHIGASGGIRSRDLPLSCAISYKAAALWSDRSARLSHRGATATIAWKLKILTTLSASHVSLRIRVRLLQEVLRRLA
jgi:hypothetical protein